MGSGPVRWYGQVDGMGDAMLQAEEGVTLFNSEENAVFVVTSGMDAEQAENNDSKTKSEFGLLALVFARQRWRLPCAMAFRQEPCAVWQRHVSSGFPRSRQHAKGYSRRH